MPSDRTHPWFQPLWRRIALTAACLVWFAVELWFQSGLWATIAFAAFAYAVWSLLIAYRGPDDAG